MHQILIRPLQISDSLISYQWRNNPDIWEFTGSRPDRIITKEIESEWLQKVLEDHTSKRFAITCDHTYIGNVQLTSITDKNAEFQIFIGEKKYWGKGISQLATYQILYYAKEILNLETSYLSVNKKNVAAIRSYEKNGFACTQQENDWLKMQVDLSTLIRPTVSVFVMVYNHELYLKECLDGILMQQCNFNYDIVVGEDFSTDNSRNILLEYQKKYPGKFRLLLHEQNIGAVTNQNSVLAACTGIYLAICEGDDYWTDPLKLQKQVDFLEANPDYSICFHRTNELKPNGELKQSEIWGIETKDTYTLEDLAKGNFMHTLSVVFRNLSPYPSWLGESPIGDYILHMLNASYGKIKYIPEVMGVYRMGVGVWSSTSDAARLEMEVKTLELLIKHSENDAIGETLSIQLIQMYKGLHHLQALDKINKSYLPIKKLIDILQEKETIIENYKNELNLESNYSGKALVRAIIRKAKQRLF